ncbi:UDP-N-acetylmuramoyl-L-alanyl-D-glutamate--2,6-diaminopimelate ligase [Psychrobacter sp. I-STPA10]|uniref:UDP-N-acetylmuramoyl-L-alanyl-D-glutamate--2, 6-diaminopimelate ligase n=1 Tax=Psychrobacter sp. I-STPA10 TaxID=2585769 RepID=UPI001E2ADB98|nr:UDP-N-acetylmuramoyl-L-alanyl-D-glutamate--2,6-diaminopimelate ligase [Psychrobacter sp. I-STPA10]
MTTTLAQLIQHLQQHYQSLNQSLTAAQQQACTQLLNSDIANIPFENLRLDSRQLNENDGFVLLKSHTQPMHTSFEYAKVASHKAAFIISEIDMTQVVDSADKALQDEQSGLVSGDTLNRCPVIHVPDIRCILGSLVQLSLSVKTDNELAVADSLPDVVAITGTNGKTTISQLVAQLCQQPDRQCAVMGTAGNGLLGQLEQASHTTGDALAVQSFLYKMAKAGVNVLALEASSHGLDQQRLQGVPVKVAIYSNLSRDHMDYHRSMSDYAAAKARLFDRNYFPHLTHAIINIDDEFAPMMQQVAKDSGLKVWTYSIQTPTATEQPATFQAAQIRPSLQGTQIDLLTDFGNICLQSPLLGRFNVANLLAAVAGAMALGVPLASLAERVQNLQGASGRMQRVESDKGCFIVDYAHTPDALTQVLTSLKTYCEGKLWAVFGCGGDRDRGKRPLMAQAGLAVADQVVLTADNPRSEDPLQILADMQQGMSEAQRRKVYIEPDRRQAIAYAVSQAAAHDIVVIAGKGHETYQEINGVRHDFDDAKELAKVLATL